MSTIARLFAPALAMGTLLPLPGVAAEGRFVVDGRARDVHVVGAAWETENGALTCSGEGNILHAGKLIGPGDFHVSVRVTLLHLGRSAASLVINGSQIGFEGKGGEMFTEGPIFGRRDLGAPVVNEGQCFDLVARREGDAVMIEIDGKTVATGTLPGAEVADVGLRPHRATMRVIGFMATATMRDRPRPLPHTTIYASGTGGYHTYRIPATVVTTRGTLLAFCEGRRTGRGDSGDIDLLVKRSSDGGETWSEPIVIWDHGANTCGNPCPVVDRNTGTVWLAMTWNHGSDHEREIMAGKSRHPRRAHVTSSADDGLTWTEPRDISDTVRKPHWRWYATGPGNAIQLRRGPHRGRLLIPANHSDHSDPDRHPYHSHVFWSDDGGETWQLGGIQEDRTNESAVVELEDGSILQAMRSYHGKNRRAMARSHDGGETWSAVLLDDALDTPVCQASIIRYRVPGDDGSLVLFSSPRGSGRSHLTVWLSRDGGKTWPIRRELYAGDSAYSNLVSLPDGRIGVLYEKDGYRTISLVTFTLGWLEEKGS